MTRRPGANIQQSRGLKSFLHGKSKAIKKEKKEVMIYPVGQLPGGAVDLRAYLTGTLSVGTQGVAPSKKGY